MMVTKQNDVDTEETSVGNKAISCIYKRGDIVKLNVGGQLFTTTFDTLTKEDSMIRTMFNGTFPVHQVVDGSVFIDRDPKYFDMVLNYMRSGGLEPPRDKNVLMELWKEAEFYQLTGMIEILENQLKEENGSPSLMRWRSKDNKVGKQVLVIKTEGEKDSLLKSTSEPMVILEVSSSSFGDEKDAIIYKHLVLFDKLSSDYGDKIIFVKQIVYTGKEWKFYTKGKLQHSVFFYNQYNGKHSFQEEIILDRILKLILL